LTKRLLKCSRTVHHLRSSTWNLADLLWVDLLAVLVEPDPWWWGTVAATVTRTNTRSRQKKVPLADIPLGRGRVASLIADESFDIPDNLSVDGAGNAVLELQVHLGNGVLGEDGGIRDITCPACQSLIFHCRTSSMSECGAC